MLAWTQHKAWQPHPRNTRDLITSQCNAAWCVVSLPAHPSKTSSSQRYSCLPSTILASFDPPPPVAAHSNFTTPSLHFPSLFLFLLYWNHTSFLFSPSLPVFLAHKRPITPLLLRSSDPLPPSKFPHLLFPLLSWPSSFGPSLPRRHFLPHLTSPPTPPREPFSPLLIKHGKGGWWGMGWELDVFWTHYAL